MAEPKTLDNLTAAYHLDPQAELHSTLWEALETLDENARLVTILFFLTGYRVKEISQLLKITSRAVESRIRRAKEKLKEELFRELANTFNENRLEETFEEDVMWRIVPRIATIEIPVKNVKLQWNGITNLLEQKQSLKIPIPLCSIFKEGAEWVCLHCT